MLFILPLYLDVFSKPTPRDSGADFRLTAQLGFEAGPGFQELPDSFGLKNFWTRKKNSVETSEAGNFVAKHEGNSVKYESVHTGTSSESLETRSPESESLQQLKSGCEFLHLKPSLPKEESGTEPMYLVDTSKDAQEDYDG
jgi:hypothetical protein